MELTDQDFNAAVAVGDIDLALRIKAFQYGGCINDKKQTQRLVDSAEALFHWAVNRHDAVTATRIKRQQISVCHSAWLKTSQDIVNSAVLAKADFEGAPYAQRRHYESFVQELTHTPLNLVYTRKKHGGYLFGTLSSSSGAETIVTQYPNDREARLASVARWGGHHGLFPGPQDVKRRNPLAVGYKLGE